MSNLTKSKLISVFSELGTQLQSPDEQLSAIINDEKQYNAWFTPESVSRAVIAIGHMLNVHDLENWLSNYNLNFSHVPKKIGLILAGNIPLVGFHDVLCVLITGNYALIKASSQDSRLIKYVLNMLVAIEPTFYDKYIIVERLEKFDAVIATGSNNTSRYFEYYFGKVPNIIRKNRSSVAVLTGNESTEQLFKLGHDIFDYFGLGCRNVSKLYVPKGYIFNFFFESIEAYQPIINHHKYNNNYDYNKSIYLVNSDKHFDNGFLMLKEDKKLASPLAVLYFEYYDNLHSIENSLETEKDNIQCIVTASPLSLKSQLVDFGMSQQPALWDYADGVDTMAFLSNL
ncbi:acyl-CoA reductase LuxC [Mucilaginibacter frigoritolerans]|uniref:Acyl-CoA reductase LuxC n=1 Tax=Mucilaginibacter frigoritolerans TaxID=652788 RepID=A0A562TY90_9SPHI|nr:acyl-CoA reductase [Mucilaginibacter frigoritolerans]TWI98036.1 acyl-CoA reductase LuxC [Mucilaginibacter frigoritolerans]